MKKIIFLLGIGLIVSQSVFSKKITKKELPASVRDSFIYTFPVSANGFLFFNKVTWYTYNNMQYYATFRFEGKRATAVFDENGSCIETIMLVNTKKMPVNILESLSSLYPGYDIFRAEDVLSEARTRYYRITISNGKNEMLVVMDYNCGVLGEKNVLDSFSRD